MASYRYPVGQLNENSDFLQIGITNYTPNKLGNASALTGTAGISTSGNFGNLFQVARKERSNTKALNHTIFLPIPSNIQDGNSVKYTEGSLDGLTAAALGAVLPLFNDSNGNPGQDLAELLRKGTAVGLDPGTREYFLRNLAVNAANIPFGGNLTASQLLARQTGNILNPNMELLFDGVTLRSFKFSFKMTPRNKTEAENVKQIIRLLKQSMSPGFSQQGFSGDQSSSVGTSKITGLYLSTPSVFELEYKRGSQPHPFLNRFKQCFLTDMSVNYTGEGTYATYGGSDADGGGTPVSMIMDLSFKELEPLYADDYTDSVGGVGY